MNNSDLELRLRNREDATLVEDLFMVGLWDHLVKQVRREHPVHLKYVEVGHDKFPEDDSAFVEFYGDEFIVTIDPRMPLGMEIDFYLHELAHVGTWFVNEPEDHGPHFGVEYAKLYRIYLEFYETYWAIYG